MTTPLALQGCAFVVTGGGSGIGRATATAAARRGARVAVSDVSAERAEVVAAEIQSLGGYAFGMAANVAHVEDLIAVRNACLVRFGRVDVVMNNVGVLALGPPESLPDEAWHRVIDMNLFSIAKSNRVFLPLLIEQGHGHLVNTASVAGLLAYGYDRLPYLASKHAIVGISEALAIYLGPRGVGVTCLCPSGVMTNILEPVAMYGEQPTSPRAPDHRIVTPEELGELAVNAVEQGRFLVLTEPEIRDELIERADDIESYLQRRIAEQTS